MQEKAGENEAPVNERPREGKVSAEAALLRPTENNRLTETTCKEFSIDIRRAKQRSAVLSKSPGREAAKRDEMRF